MKRVFNLLVVDESGSMSIIKRHALVGINETLTTIQKMQETHKNLEQRVTLSLTSTARTADTQARSTCSDSPTPTSLPCLRAATSKWRLQRTSSEQAFS